MQNAESREGDFVPMSPWDSDLAQTEDIYRTRLRQAPDDARLRFGLALALLARGKWSEGWPLYEARYDVPELNASKPPLPFPEWRGESLSGARILIWPEQGLGDQIMFARYAPWMRDQGADVTLVCPPTLARLFASSFEGVRVVPSAGAAEFPTPTHWAMCASLAGIAGHRPEDVPNRPYLFAGDQYDGDGIGVMVRGNPEHRNDVNRSLDLAAASRVLQLPGATSLHPHDTGFTDFQQTALKMAGLSEIISVDTAVAHLAGAMGKKVTTLISRRWADWRWLNADDGLPWYPQMKLLRQQTSETWSPELEQLEHRLATHNIKPESAP